MEPIEEQTYIERIKKGDTLAYGYLVNKYKDMAFTIALKITRNREEAQDVAQESFLKAYQQIRSFLGKSEFSTWLYSIVYRTAINRLNAKHLKNVSFSEELPENYTTDFSIPPLEQLQIQQQQRYVKAAIDKLPPTEALLITLYYLNENTVKEIGEITGLSLANIKIQLFRARKRLERDLAFLLEDHLKNTQKDGTPEKR